MISCVFINIWGLIFSQVCHAKMWFQDLSHTKLQATEYPWNTSFNLCLQKYTSKVSYVKFITMSLAVDLRLNYNIKKIHSVKYSVVKSYKSWQQKYAIDFIKILSVKHKQPRE